MATDDRTQSATKCESWCRVENPCCDAPAVDAATIARLNDEANALTRRAEDAEARAEAWEARAAIWEAFGRALMPYSPSHVRGCGCQLCSARDALFAMLNGEV